MADMKEKQTKEETSLQAECDKANALAKSECDAVIAQVEASQLAKLKAVRREAEVLATAFDLKYCEFCEEEFYPDEWPNWNSQWGGIHCGEYCIGECPKCGKGKLKLEGTWDYEDCESHGFVFTCEGCRGSGLSGHFVRDLRI